MHVSVWPFSHGHVCLYYLCYLYLVLYMFFCRLCVHRVRVCLCVHRVWVFLYVPV